MIWQKTYAYDLSSYHVIINNHLKLSILIKDMWFASIR